MVLVQIERVAMGKNLFQKVWEAHTVRSLPGGGSQILIGLHLLHEVTSPQAFGMLKDLGLKDTSKQKQKRPRNKRHGRPR